MASYHLRRHWLSRASKNVAVRMYWEISNHNCLFSGDQNNLLMQGYRAVDGGQGTEGGREAV